MASLKRGSYVIKYRNDHQHAWECWQYQGRKLRLYLLWLVEFKSIYKYKSYGTDLSCTLHRCLMYWIIFSTSFSSFSFFIVNWNKMEIKLFMSILINLCDSDVSTAHLWSFPHTHTPYRGKGNHSSAGSSNSNSLQHSLPTNGDNMISGHLAADWKYGTVAKCDWPAITWDAITL